MHYAALGINEGIVAYDNEDPVISDIVITNVSTLGYTVSCKITDNWGLKNVAFPTWTVKNNQDDLFRDFFNTQQGTRDGDIYSFRVNSSDHNNETGEYITHIYATDMAGTRINAHCDSVIVTGSPSQQIVVSADSSYKKEGVYIKNIKPETTANAFMSEFASTSLSVCDKNNTVIDGLSFVGTGSILKLYSGSTLRDSMTLIVSGDANGDGTVSAEDARLILRSVVGLERLSPESIVYCNSDFDATVGASDARLALRIAVGLEESQKYAFKIIELDDATCINDGYIAAECQLTGKRIDMNFNAYGHILPENYLCMLEFVW
jgi:hypothetical protein